VRQVDRARGGGKPRGIIEWYSSSAWELAPYAHPPDLDSKGRNFMNASTARICTS
jgi:hypothetical protein